MIWIRFKNRLEKKLDKLNKILMLQKWARLGIVFIILLLGLLSLIWKLLFY